MEEGDEIIRYYYSGNSLLKSSNGEDVKFYYQDRLGSNRVTVTQDGEVSNFKSYPYGQGIVEEIDKGFSGKEKDESGLHYFGARYYDSDLGRFTSVDPVQGNEPYAYVSNNPMMGVDPDGRFVNLVRPGDSGFGVPQSQVSHQSSSWQASYNAGRTAGNLAYFGTGVAVGGGYLLAGGVMAAGGTLPFAIQNQMAITEVVEEGLMAANGMDAPTSIAGSMVDMAGASLRQVPKIGRTTSFSNAVRAPAEALDEIVDDILPGIVELPAREAIGNLWKKRVPTWTSSANADDLARGWAYIGIDATPGRISPTNREILDQVDGLPGVSLEMQFGSSGNHAALVKFSVDESTTIGSLSQRMNEVADMFQSQPNYLGPMF